jgi:hypothetical protein
MTPQVPSSRFHTNLARQGVYITAILLASSLSVADAQVPAATPAVSTIETVEPANPVLGYVFDRSQRTIHPLAGTTDDVQLGPALARAPTLSTFAAAPGHDYGLGVDAPSGAAYFLQLTPTSASSAAISAINNGADRIVMSPAGTAAAFYDRQSRSVQIVSGLPAARKVRGPIPLDKLSGLITSMAVNDAGDSLLVGVSEQSGGALHLAGPSRNLRKITAAGRVASIAFLPESNDAVIADHDRNQVVLIRDIVKSPETSVLGGEQDGIVQPASVAASRDGLSIYVTSSQRRRVTELPTALGRPSFVDCDCRPGLLTPLAGNAVFGLSAASDSPFFIYDGDQETDAGLDPRIVLVPSANPAARSQPATPQPLRRRRGRSAR